jgi:uncharacterized protein YpmS
MTKVKEKIIRDTFMYFKYLFFRLLIINTIVIAVTIVNPITPASEVAIIKPLWAEVLALGLSVFINGAVV